MAVDIINQFTRICTLSTFLYKQHQTCDAKKFPSTIRTLALFKYILPDEINFDYEETPFDPVYGSEPKKVLCFYFPDKKAGKRTIDDMKLMINERVQRFKTKLHKLLNKGSTIQDLLRECEVCIPLRDETEMRTKIESRAINGALSTKGVVVKDENASSIPVADKDDMYATYESLKDGLSEIVSEYTEPAKPAAYGSCPSELKEYVDIPNSHEDSKEIKLYTHQSKALNYLLENPNGHLIVSTSTASGKSLIFKTIVKYELDHNPNSCAMFIYPTKALAQDQLRSFGFSDAYTFDGDVPFSDRENIRRNARILFLNPDIIHATLLPNWREWMRVLENLKYVVIDEVHVYSGIFGANVAMVLRRLRRICYQLGADVRFIGCSATVKNPQSIMTTLLGVSEDEVECIDEDGSPTGLKRYIFCTPEEMAKGEINSGRYHPIREAAPLLVQMVHRKMQVIAFCRYRRECELLLKAVYEIDPSLGPNNSQEEGGPKVMGYRGGYSAEDRRAIEKRMFNGEICGIVATSALELGIDIGALDAAIIVGFPYSIASFRQQVGRVGRRTNESIVVYVADGSVLDQVHAKNIDNVLHGALETVPICLHDSIVRSHIQMAAYEQPLDTDDLKFFPKTDLDVARLVQLDDGLYGFPTKPEINIRKTEEEDVTLVINERNKVIESIERERVGFTLYEGAIFVHQGVPYLVTNLEENLLYAKVQRTKVSWVTRQRDFTDVDPISFSKSKAIIDHNNEPDLDQPSSPLDTESQIKPEVTPIVSSGVPELVPGVSQKVHEGMSGVTTEIPKLDQEECNEDKNDQKNPIYEPSVNIGKVKVTTVVFGYFKFNKLNQIIDRCEVKIPPIIRIRKSIWINIPLHILSMLKTCNYHTPAAIHAAEHVLISAMPLNVSMSPGDVCTECKAPEKEFSKTQTSRQRVARLIFYDKYGGYEGSGILQTVYENIKEVMRNACNIVDNCPCELGCSNCIAFPQCTEHNAVLSKRGAQLILRMLLLKPNFLEGLPEGSEPNLDEKGKDLVNVISVEASTHI